MQSSPWTYKCGQFHVAILFLIWGRNLLYVVNTTLGGPQFLSGSFVEKKTSCLCWGENCVSSVIRPNDESLFNHALVFSLRGRVGRSQSPVM